MRSNCALYVDVGYLIAASATRVTGTSLRSGVVVSYPDLVKRLISAAETASGMPLLRVHWYDSGKRSGGTPDSAQEAIGMLPRVKLRLGRISPQGEQKGVDLRIGLDLAAHGRNRVVDVIYLVSGDDDLCEAVEEAQNHGVQVVLMAVPDASGKAHAVSKHLIREADDLIVLDGAVVDETVHVRQLQPDAAEELELSAAAAAVDVPLPGPRPAASAAAPVDGARPRESVAAGAAPARPTPLVLAALSGLSGLSGLAATKPGPRPTTPHPSVAPAGVGGGSGSGLVWSSASDGSGAPADASITTAELELIDEVCRGVIATWSSTAGAGEHGDVMRGRPYIPGDLDRALLLDLSSRLGVYDLDDHLRYLLRDHFWQVLGEARR
jgi:hypothetical protein